jgi:hypothetical protein
LDDQRLGGAGGVTDREVSGRFFGLGDRHLPSLKGGEEAGEWFGYLVLRERILEGGE